MLSRLVAILGAASGAVALALPRDNSVNSLTSQNGETVAQRIYFYVGGEYVNASIVSEEGLPITQRIGTKSDDGDRMGPK